MEGNHSYAVEVKIHAGTSKRGIVLKDEKNQYTIHIYTTQKPLEGRANKDAKRILSDYLGVRKSSIALIRGEKSRNKLFLVETNKKMNGEKLKYIREV